MSEGIKIAMALLGGYLLGSLPFGLWVAYRCMGVDIRTLGSKNIGSTNVGRVCGRGAGIGVFILDVLKGFVPPLVAAYALHLPSQWQIGAAFAAILGHNFSVWLRFQGGKGIATSLGALLGVAPLVGLAAFAVWGVSVLALGWVSLASIIAALSLPILMQLLYVGDPYRLGFGIVACIMAIYKHRANIARLRAGVEPKVALPWRPKADGESAKK